jgi:glycerophosphoryl diester phosphodiesterase
MKSTFGCVFVLAVFSMIGCGEEGSSSGSSTAANLVVRQRIAQFAPAVNFAHRGQGPTRVGNPFPENSLAAFRAAIAQGTDGIEMDSELTEDGQLVLMHDDTVNRTSECSGCVSKLSFDAVRRCRLLDGDGQVTDQVPPTLDEVFQLQPSNVLVNVELKAFSGDCLTAGHGPVELATAMVNTLRRLGVEERTVVQSFDAQALATVKQLAPEIYTAFLVSGLRPRDITTAVGVQADALQPGGPFPFLSLNPTDLRAARDAGLQVIVWTVDDAASINTLLDNGIDGIITDDPALVKQIVAGRR